MDAKQRLKSEARTILTEELAPVQVQAFKFMRSQAANLVAASTDRDHLLTALKALEPHHVIYPDGGSIRTCDLCGGETGHLDDCPFAVIAKVEGCDHDLPEPADDGPALHAELTQELARVREQMFTPLEVTLAELSTLHALLADAPALLELAADMAVFVRCGTCPARDDCARDGGDRSQWPCHTVPRRLDELAAALREVGMGEEEEG